MMFPNDAPPYRKTISHRVDGDAKDIIEVAKRVEKTMLCARPEKIEGWLVELDAITARRGISEFSTAVMLTAYTTRLQEYPADIARHVLFSCRWKFFPTWDELREKADTLKAARQAKINALLRAAEAKTIALGSLDAK
ncbi:MAG: hypothetical protein KTR28_08780 [Micavibrio sp.]|nr:hypothetical protein [Micavibrio sp.]